MNIKIIKNKKITKILFKNINNKPGLEINKKNICLIKEI